MKFSIYLNRRVFVMVCVTCKNFDIDEIEKKKKKKKKKSVLYYPQLLSSLFSVSLCLYIVLYVLCTMFGPRVKI